MTQEQVLQLVGEESSTRTVRKPRVADVAEVRLG